jgi:uncharacterized protein (DUF433 family)
VWVSNGRQEVEAEGDSLAEPWYRVAQKALQEKDPMTPTIWTDPAPLRADESGTLRVGNSRITLDVLVREYEEGADPEGIVRGYSTLTLAEVYGAIAYYLRHKAELDEYLRVRREEAARLRQEIEASQAGRPNLRETLEARRARQEQDHASPCG